MRFAVVSRITSYSCTKRPTAFHEDASSSDRELMAPPIDSSFVRLRGTDTWPIGANSLPSTLLPLYRGAFVTVPLTRSPWGRSKRLKVAFLSRILDFTGAGKGIKRDFHSRNRGLSDSTTSRDGRRWVLGRVLGGS